MTFVDIRDVAKAHLSAGLDAKWHGRNLICSCSDTFMGLGQMVRTECQFENVATDYCPYCPLMCVPALYPPPIPGKERQAREAGDTGSCIVDIVAGRQKVFLPTQLRASGSKLSPADPVHCPCCTWDSAHCANSTMPLLLPQRLSVLLARSVVWLMRCGGGYTYVMLRAVCSRRTWA